MSTMTAPAAPPTVSDAAVRRLGRFYLFAAIYTYTLIIFGGLVRITDSGLGCGNDWPKCHGRWIPEFTVPTLIEYVHRLLGVTIGLLAIALAFYAWQRRHQPRFRGRAGLAAPAYIALALVIIQGMLGAITVWLDLPAGIIVVHFLTALILMAVMLLGAVRADALGRVETSGNNQAARRHARAATAALALGFLTVALGALTANSPGAPAACQGFPLCNGKLLPANVSLVHIHWTHRLLAFALLLHVLMAALRAQSAAAPMRLAAFSALFLIASQITVAAGLILMQLPSELQVLHLAVGAAVWAALVAWALLARAAAAQPLP